MLADMNVVVFGGRLAKDPIIRDVGETMVANFKVISNRRFLSKGEKREETIGMDVEAWGSVAKGAKLLTKGMPCMVNGYLKEDSWVDKETGKKQIKRVIVARSINFDPKSKQDGVTEDGSGDDDVVEEDNMAAPF